MSPDSYRYAGVDLQAADDLKDRIGAFASITHGKEVLSGVGAFAGLYRLKDYKEPVLVASTDGVGTKLKVAALLSHYESLGIDLVNLNVNDVITARAKPLFFLDYISIGKLDPQVIEPLLRGMAWACREVGCALIGGETAQAPGVYVGDDFDLAGTLVGVVEESEIIDVGQVEKGDVLLGLPSSGIHTNGFSLVRKVFDIDSNPSVLYRRFEELGHTLGEELLIPHKSYYPRLAGHYAEIKAIAHITGGGIVGNLPRILPWNLAGYIEANAWVPPPIFHMIQEIGALDFSEMYQVFNMGLGMVLICGPEREASLRRGLPEAVVVGEVVKQRDENRVVIDST